MKWRACLEWSNPTYSNLSRLKCSYYIIFIFCLFTRFFLCHRSYPLVHPTSQEISSRLHGSTQKKKKTTTTIIFNNKPFVVMMIVCRCIYFNFILFYLNIYIIYNMYKCIIINVLQRFLSKYYVYNIYIIYV